MFGVYVRLARVKDWVKNVFILLPLPFALASGNIAELDVLRFALGLAGFCLVSSAVYCYNDALDAEADRLHPKKKLRPVAAGLISVRAAMVLAFGLLAAGGTLEALSGSPLALSLTMTYAGLNVLYSRYAKHRAPVDILMLASFFILRVYVGCALVGAAPSNWLLLCSFTVSLFLVLTKRRADLVEGVDETHRQALAGYNLEFLNQAMGITAGIALLSYALYTMETSLFIEGREFWSVPFVAAGLLDYLRLAHTRGLGGSPVDVALSEPSILLWGGGWVIAILTSLDLPWPG